MKILNSLKKIGIYILNIILSQKVIVIVALIGVIAGLIWGAEVGFFTFFGLGVAFVAFIFLRQLWWWITKTGDYYEADNT